MWCSYVYKPVGLCTGVYTRAEKKTRWGSYGRIHGWDYIDGVGLLTEFCSIQKWNNVNLKDTKMSDMPLLILLPRFRQPQVFFYEPENIVRGAIIGHIWKSVVL